jgi:Uncharacterized protein conserved in bacteria
MKKSNFVYLITFIFVLCSCNTPQKSEEKNALLWKISGKDLPQSSYIFGTWNGGDKDSANLANIYNNYPHFGEAFNSVSYFMTESSPEEQIGHITSSHKFISNMYLKKDTTYRDIFDEASLQKLDSLTTKYLNKSVYQIGVKPLFLMYALSSAKEETEYEQKGLDWNKDRGMNAHLFYLAKDKKHITRTLGSRADVWDMLLPYYGQPLLTQTEMVKYLLTPEGEQSSLKIESINDSITNAYLKHDINSILVSFEDMDKINPLSRFIGENVIESQNRRWISKIVPAIEENPTFIAIGVRSLYGENGLINLLRKKGYTVESVM